MNLEEALKWADEWGPIGSREEPPDGDSAALLVLARTARELQAHVAELESTLARLTDADNARDFPRNTCGASRHAQQIGEDMMQGDADSQFRGAAILTTVRCLWECRTRVAELESALNSATPDNPDSPPHSS